MLSLKSERIPRATIRRLAVYVQVLESMQRNGVEVISSGPLAEACDVNASQVRKDLANFGEFGVRGVGYNVASLIAAIKASLGVDREWRAALIGVGNLGRALLHHAEFKARGCNIVGAFDCDPFKIGEQVYGLEVTCTSDLKSAVDAKGIEIGIITTPPEQEMDTPSWEQQARTALQISSPFLAATSAEGICLTTATNSSPPTLARISFSRVCARRF